MGHHAGRGRRPHLRRRRSRRAVREPRRRRDVGAQPGAVGAPDATALAAATPAACRCTRSRPWPGDPQRLALAISAAGVWLTEDGGATWAHGNEGIVADYLPEEARATAIDLCVHHLERAPAPPGAAVPAVSRRRLPLRRRRRTWTDIAAGLPHDFGFPVVLDPADPDSAYVIPVTTADRVTDGRVAVFETRDAGATWTARDEGLPQGAAYLSVLRQSFAGDRRGRRRCELYFGATSGEIFGSGDAGAHAGRASRNAAAGDRVGPRRPERAGARGAERGRVRARADYAAAHGRLPRSHRPPLVPVGARLVGLDARQGAPARRRRGHHRPRGRRRHVGQGRGPRHGRRGAARAAVGGRAHERARQRARARRGVTPTSSRWRPAARGPDSIIVPKVESRGDLEFVDRLLDGAEAAAADRPRAAARAGAHRDGGRASRAWTRSPAPRRGWTR